MEYYFIPNDEQESEDSIADAAQTAFFKLDKYYNVSSELCTIATVLDPRLKLDYYRLDISHSAENPDEFFLYVKSFYEKDYAGIVNISYSSLKMDGNKMFKQIYNRESSDIPISEFDVYISEPVLKHSSKFSVLDYCKSILQDFQTFTRLFGSTRNIDAI